MHAVIDISGTLALWEDGVWRCDDKILERQLNEYLEQMEEDDTYPGGDDPQPQETIAQQTVRRFGGTVEESIGPMGKAGEVY